MSKVSKLLVGLLLTTLIAATAHFFVRDTIATLLQKRSLSVLTAKNQGWAKIQFTENNDSKMRYRVGYLSGPAPSDDARTAARTDILNALSTYSFDGGVHDVVLVADHSSQPKSSYAWRAEIKDKQVILSGMVPSEAIRADLISYATDKFKDSSITVVDRMQLASGAPAGDWATTAKHGIAAIALLGNEYAELSDTNLKVVAHATTIASKDVAIAAASNALPSSFVAMPEITVEGAEPATQAIVDNCQKQFDAIMVSSVVEFDIGKASLREKPNTVLDKIATAAIKCPGTRIIVAGHTDKRGNASANQVLSQSRASAVVGYLKSHHVAADRLSAKGYGSTQPLDTADNEAAYQKNRRIQFTVGSAH